jgi:uncharacterized SAM-binding protein YcdF (DUF218 family)
VDAIARLQAGASIAVVLGGGRTALAARVRAAAAAARERQDLVLILSGSHPPTTRERPERSEAALMRDALLEAGLAADRLLLEDESRDTLGNAVFTAVRYLAGLEPRTVLVISSPSHVVRAVRIFERVLGAGWLVEAVASEPSGADRARGAIERALAREADDFFAGLRPGDLPAIAARLRARYPYYAAAERLTTWST